MRRSYTRQPVRGWLGCLAGFRRFHLRLLTVLPFGQRAGGSQAISPSALMRLAPWAWNSLAVLSFGERAGRPLSPRFHLRLLTVLPFGQRPGPLSRRLHRRVAQHCKHINAGTAEGSHLSRTCPDNYEFDSGGHLREPRVISEHPACSPICKRAR